jgi:hypothetical protein
MATTTKKKATRKKPTAKPRKRTSAKATSAKTTTKKATSKKATAKKATAKKTTSKGKTKASPKREHYGPQTNEHGLVPGSDTATMLDIMLEGGTDRNDINSQVEKAIKKSTGLQTRAGNDKNIPTMVSSLLSRMQEKGYTIESSWVLVPPAEGSKKGKKRKSRK